MSILNPHVPLGESTLFRLATEFPDTLTVTTGTLNAGTVADVSTIGGNVVDVTEVVGSPGFNIVFDWTGVVGVPRRITMVGYYAGEANHGPTCDIYDYVSAGFVNVETFYDQSGNHTFVLPANSRFVSAGAMSLRLYHAANGVGTHSMFIDYLAAEMWRE